MNKILISISLIQLSFALKAEEIQILNNQELVHPTNEIPVDVDYNKEKDELDFKVRDNSRKLIVVTTPDGNIFTNLPNSPIYNSVAVDNPEDGDYYIETVDPSGEMEEYNFTFYQK